MINNIQMENSDHRRVNCT